MKKEFVTYEIALKLKELGFNEECMGLYYKTEFKLADFISLPYFRNSETQVANITPAPLWQQVIDWLRIEHNLILEINYSDCKWWQWIIIYSNDNIHVSGTNDTDDIDLPYESVLEIGIRQAFLLIK